MASKKTTSNTPPTPPRSPSRWDTWTAQYELNPDFHSVVPVGDAYVVFSALGTYAVVVDAVPLGQQSSEHRTIRAEDTARIRILRRDPQMPQRFVVTYTHVVMTAGFRFIHRKSGQRLVNPSISETGVVAVFVQNPHQPHDTSLLLLDGEGNTKKLSHVLAGSVCFDAKEPAFFSLLTKISPDESTPQTFVEVLQRWNLHDIWRDGAAAQPLWQQEVLSGHLAPQLDVETGSIYLYDGWHHTDQSHTPFERYGAHQVYVCKEYVLLLDQTSMICIKHRGLDAGRPLWRNEDFATGKQPPWQLIPSFDGASFFGFHPYEYTIKNYAYSDGKVQVLETNTEATRMGALMPVVAAYDQQTVIARRMALLDVDATTGSVRDFASVPLFGLAHAQAVLDDPQHSVSTYRAQDRGQDWEHTQHVYFALGREHIYVTTTNWQDQLDAFTPKNALQLPLPTTRFTQAYPSPLLYVNVTGRKAIVFCDNPHTPEKPHALLVVSMDLPQLLNGIDPPDAPVHVIPCASIESATWIDAETFVCVVDRNLRLYRFASDTDLQLVWEEKLHEDAHVYPVHPQLDLAHKKQTLNDDGSVSYIANDNDDERTHAPIFGFWLATASSWSLYPCEGPARGKANTKKIKPLLVIKVGKKILHYGIPHSAAATASHIYASVRGHLFVVDIHKKSIEYALPNLHGEIYGFLQRSLSGHFYSLSISSDQRYLAMMNRMQSGVLSAIVVDLQKDHIAGWTGPLVDTHPSLWRETWCSFVSPRRSTEQTSNQPSDFLYIATMHGRAALYVSPSAPSPYSISTHTPSSNSY